MLAEERQFPRFLQGLLTEFYRTLISDREVFLLFLGGHLLTTRRRGIGVALLLFVILRRSDEYVNVATQIAQLAYLKREPPSTSSENVPTDQA